jgi:transcription elongation factor Elf1
MATNWTAKEVRTLTKKYKVFQCPPPCDHKWDGPEYVSKDGLVHSATCSKCGVAAIDVDLMRLP